MPAGKAIQIVAGGVGVASAAPFTAGQYTIITAAPSPTITAGRLGQLGDAVQSIVAIGTGGPASSFVMGNLADNQGQADNLVIADGYTNTNVAGNGIRGVKLGGRIAIPAAQGSAEDIVAIGWDIVWNAGSLAIGQTIAIGRDLTFNNAAGTGSANVLIGVACTMTGSGGTGVGVGVSVRQQSAVFGRGALSSGDQAAAFGEICNAGLRGVAVGNRARTDNTFGGGSIAIGFFTDALQVDAIAIGRQATANFANAMALGTLAVAGAADSIAIGAGASTAIANQCTIGSEASFITLFLVGGASVSATTRTLQFRPTAALPGNANQAGWSLDIVAAWGTGNAATGQISFQTGVVAGAGGALQAIAERLAVIPSTGAAAAPILRFANFTTGVAAAALPAIVNAPLARQPIDYIPVVTPAGQGWIPVF